MVTISEREDKIQMRASLLPGELVRPCQASFYADPVAAVFEGLGGVNGNGHPYIIAARDRPTVPAKLEVAHAIATGNPYQTWLNPPPGPPTDATGNFIPMAQWDPANWPEHIHAPKRVD